MNKQNKTIHHDTLSEHTIKRINNYMFDMSDRIGSGLTSTVYRGKNYTTGLLVAIKVIQLKKINQQVGKHLLANQVQALSIINNSNILHSLYTTETLHNLYIVTQLFQQSLEDFLKKKGKFSQPQVMKFLCTMANALNYLQKLGIIHRDIKPANIFIKNNNYILGDLGFCHFINTPLLQKGFNVGSPLYMSPEAYKNSIYSFKSDIWSLGISILELLTGEKPSSNMTYQEIIHSVCEQKFYRNFNISDRLKQLLDLMLDSNIQNRITPQDLLKRLSLESPENEAILKSNKINLKNKTESTLSRQKSSSKIITQQDKQLSSKNAHKRRISHCYFLINDNQQNFILNDDIKTVTKDLTTKPLVQNNKQYGNVKKYQISSNHCQTILPNQTLILQNLCKVLFADPKIMENQFKLKLLRLLCLVTNIQFPQIFYIHIKHLPLDKYFNYIMDTVIPSQINVIQHYLIYLLQNIMKQYESYQQTKKIQDQNHFNKLNCLRNALYLWKPKNIQKNVHFPHIISMNAVQKNGGRNKSKSLHHYIPDNRFEKRQRII